MLVKTKLVPRDSIIDIQWHLRFIGLIAVLLPLIVYAYAYLSIECTIQESLSHYFYTVSGHLFSGLLTSIGFLMVLYKGYEKLDQVSAIMAGGCAIAVAFIPTSNNYSNCCLFEYPVNSTRVVIHYVAAGLLFITLAFMCLFLFTKYSTPFREKTKLEKLRIGSFYILGFVILLMVLSIFLYHQNKWFRDICFKDFVFYAEWICTLSFGIAWLIKSWDINEKP